ncbi:SusF/SusE family outer membrane protein [Marinilabilia sp.]|uniref:SusF/SusE family outer membrane protein n=1 Tax=Marinilabilia sp. TaxID=2021252 RepID=UPI0025BB2B92|nr:SusF/SusE family outer membrane protein [Marinilabilia sp.]
MQTKNIDSNWKKSLYRLPFFLLAILMAWSVESCSDDYDEVEIAMGEPVSLSVSNSEVTLTQKQADSEAIKFIWTTGTNMGTGSSISYTLEIDRAGNDFASAISYNMGKGIYQKSFTHKELNTMLMNQLGVSGNTDAEIEVRITASVAAEGVEAQQATSTLIAFTYKPVSETLYLIGDATPNGWSADEATPLTQKASDPTSFTYSGALSAGELKFITEQGQFMPSYNKGADDNTLVFRTEDTQPDDKFLIEEGGIYAIELNLVDLTISIEKQEGPAYEVLYMVGDATPNGWDIANAVEMTQNPDNLFQFTWEGVLTTGEFKIPVNRNSDWGQDMFMPEPDDPTKAFLHEGGTDGDYKWVIESENYYYITLDLSDNSISIEPFNLYMVGSAGPSGWDIGNATELTQDPDNWYIFTYEGPMNAGEFKFPVNQNSDWGQDMYMRDPSDATKMYRHIGGEDDDNKWTIPAGEEGDYILTLNVQDLTIDIQKQ